MASISSGGIVLPSWFLAVATAAFVTATGAIIKLEWNLSETVAADDQQVKQNTNDIRRLYEILPDVAALKADVAATRDVAEKTDAKVDRLIDRELGRRKP